MFIDQIIKKNISIIKIALLWLVALCLCSQSYAQGIQANSHTVYYGDINADGHNDLYLAKNNTSETGHNFKLFAVTSGYEQPVIDDGISVANLTTGQFRLHDLDLNGDGIVDVFIQSTRSNTLSLTLTNDITGNAPSIIQTFANLGSDTTQLTISDLNNDARDDVTYQVSGQTVQLYADQQGHLLSNGLMQVTASYGYDYLNHRRYKVVEALSQNRVETQYIDSNTELRNGQLYKYVTIGGQKVALSIQEGGTYAPSSYYLTNHIGSTTLTLDESAAVKSAEIYDPFGDTQSYGETDANHYKFTGKEFDAENQLTYMHHRYYDASSSRFITPDPVFYTEQRLTDPQRFSPYAYARNNPITYVDPTGEVLKLATTAGKVVYKAFKQYQKTGKVDSASLKKLGKDELIGAADDLNTIFADGDAGFLDKLGAGIDLVTGLETTDGDIREVADILGGAKVKKVAKNEGKTFQTYTKTNPDTGQTYCGRTSGCGTPEQNIARRDAAHHMNKDGYGPAILDKSSTNSAAIRGREQQIINAHGGAQSKNGVSGNKINGISENNKKKDYYFDQAYKEFGG